MRILFIHQNAPGQFRHIIPHLARDRANEIVLLGDRMHALDAPVRTFRYKPPLPASPRTHHYLHRTESAVRRGQNAARACLALKDQGFTPDLIVAHPGWGETLFLRDALPHARQLLYCELFYRPTGQDLGATPELPTDLDAQCRLRTWNADLLAALEAMDHGLSPTRWQRAQHPAFLQDRIATIHEGVDTQELRPDPAATFTLPDGRTLTAADEIVTYVARNLEPVRGFPALMRSLPPLLRQRPNAQILICGEEGVSYGRRPPNHPTWRAALEAEIPPDPRIHFLGRLARPQYIRLLQISSLHLYLSVPFVLSWSVIEAMATGATLLAANTAPIREIIEPGVNGFLTHLTDPETIAADAAALLARRHDLAPIHQAARATVLDRFDLRDSLAAQQSLIQDVAACESVT